MNNICFFSFVYVFHILYNTHVLLFISKTISLSMLSRNYFPKHEINKKVLFSKMSGKLEVKVRKASKQHDFSEPLNAYRRKYCGLLCIPIWSMECLFI